ncbi:hypothetical protein BV25DRAFT_1988780 [Artomyces pyxidatus]|uniref:Uncharacterized protein n=1 Tax=Artomyces pyxidatus TaxID=48021 RepID=A0ACB8T9S5_9AGAM|nr:hypothetical protein BV25DRAFT_1988780 [Artomyces pyxidatus]
MIIGVILFEGIGQYSARLSFRFPQDPSIPPQTTAHCPGRCKLHTAILGPLLRSRRANILGRTGNNLPIPSHDSGASSRHPLGYLYAWWRPAVSKVFGAWYSRQPCSGSTNFPRGRGMREDLKTAIRVVFWSKDQRTRRACFFPPSIRPTETLEPCR